ncbi:MAG: anaerobic ribonucleoside-triphosphate reductase activating protein [Bacilli bacterium]|nr:anaerobic ribonucleoside-triphosphate reductase activating protein [Bacilli bacterium]
MCFVGLEKASLVDYDGYVSAVLFTQQCNLRCLFCQNTKLIFGKNDIIPWEEIKSFLTKNKNNIDAVVITGGEPLIHKNIIKKLEEIKKLGFLVKLDTNGTNPVMLENILKNKLVDYVAIDIKNDFDNYNYIVGAKQNNNEIVNNIKESIRCVKTNNIPFEFRTTIIKQFHNLSTLLKIAKTISPCPKYVLQRYQFQKDCLFYFQAIEKEEAEKLLKDIKKIIPNTFLRGY